MSPGFVFNEVLKFLIFVNLDTRQHLSFDEQIRLFAYLPDEFDSFYDSLQILSTGIVAFVKVVEVNFWHVPWIG